MLGEIEQRSAAHGDSSKRRGRPAPAKWGGVVVSLVRWRRAVGLAWLLAAVSGIGGGAAVAAEGTPTTGALGGEIGALLGVAPAEALFQDAPQIVTFADVAAQAAAVGVAPPTVGEDVGRFRSAVAPLAVPRALAQNGSDPAWREAFGFDLGMVDAVAEVGVPPETTLLLRGKFDEAALRAAWERSGYRTVGGDAGAAVVVSLDEEARVDLASPVGRLALASMNNGAILPDGTLAFAPSRTGLRAVLDVVAGRAASLAEAPSVAAVLATAPPDLASGMLLRGDALAAVDPIDAIVMATPGDLEAVATEIAAEMTERARMPPVLLAAIGTTVGGPLPAGAAASGAAENEAVPTGRLWGALLMAGDRDADAAVPVIQGRLETGRSSVTDEPYARWLPAEERRVSIVAGAPIVLLDLGLGKDAPPGLWMRLYAARDLGFVAW